MNRILGKLCVVILFCAAQAWGQTVEYIHTDALGSPVAITNSSGAVVERTVYEPYGAIVNRPLTNGPGFAGHVTDSVTGLVYMQQRYYDPTLGRFLSVDPVSADGISGSNFNRYWYAENNPYTYRDPDGQLAFLIPVGIACVESGVCVAAAIWAVRVVGAIAVGAIVENALSESQEGAAPGSDSNATDKKVPNPDGSKGKQDHQDAVSELETKAAGEARPGEQVVREKKVKGHDSNRRPDVQILDEEGKTRKILEAEREPDSRRVQGKRDEYTDLGIEHEIYDLDLHQRH